MAWSALHRIVADAATATVSGSRCAGGTLLSIAVVLNVNEWPWDQLGAVTLVPKPALVRAVTRRGELILGMATPDSAQVVTPMAQSSTATVQFTVGLSMSALTELEVARDGGPIELAMNLVAHPVPSGNHPREPLYPTSIPFKFKVPLEEWLATLSSIGFCETLITELALPTTGPPSTAAGRTRLGQAVAARNNGGYAEAMRTCRIALDELGNAGFGGKAPQEVVAFLKERAATLTQTERYSALKVALELYLSPTHHANAPEEHYTRADADLALAMTAALLKTAAVRGGRDEDPA